MLLGFLLWLVISLIILIFFTGADAIDNYEWWDGEEDER